MVAWEEVDLTLVEFKNWELLLDEPAIYLIGKHGLFLNTLIFSIIHACIILVIRGNFTNFLHFTPYFLK
jgi:hypothetical protein